MPYLDALVVWNENEGEIAAFMVNRSETEEMQTELFLQGFLPKRIKKSAVLTAEDKKMTNAADHQAVILKERKIALLEEGRCLLKLPPLSFSMVILEL